MSGRALLGPFLAMPLGSGTLTSNDLPEPSEIHQGLGPYGPGCSYATARTHPSHTHRSDSQEETDGSTPTVVQQNRDAHTAHSHTHRSDSQEETDGSTPTVVQQNGDTHTTHSHTHLTKAPKVMAQTDRDFAE